MAGAGESRAVSTGAGEGWDRGEGRAKNLDLVGLF